MKQEKQASWQTYYFVSFVLVILTTVLVSTIYQDQLGDIFQGTGRAYWSDSLIAPINRLVNWDFGVYLYIAEKWYGYLGNELVFPPVYPLLIRVVGTLLFGQYKVAGFFISWGSIYAACAWLYQYYQEKFDRQTSLRAIQYMLIFPTAFYFFTGYTESLFFLLMVVSWWAAEKRKWWLAGVLGFLATLTRFVGVFLVIPFAYLWIKEPLKQKLRAAAAIGLIPLAYMGWSLYAEHQFGIRPSMIIFQGWPLRLEWPWVGVAGTIQGIFTQPFEKFIFGYFDLFILLLALITLVWNIYRKRYPEAILILTYSIVSLLKVSSEGYLIAVSRYLLILFPIFTSLAEWGRGRVFHRIWLAISICLLVFATSLFIFGYWVA